MALKDYKNGVTCDCGNEIWVIGSVFAGRRCFTFFTGDSDPSRDFEIPGANSKTSGITYSFNDEIEGIDEEKVRF